jgi:hypothetical protein
MAEQEEGTFVRLVRFLALGVPMLSRVLAVAFVVVALALAFFEFGGYDETTRADLAMLFAAFALAALAIGWAVPRFIARFLPRRR